MKEHRPPNRRVPQAHRHNFLTLSYGLSARTPVESVCDNDALPGHTACIHCYGGYLRLPRRGRRTVLLCDRKSSQLPAVAARLCRRPVRFVHRHLGVDVFGFMGTNHGSEARRVVVTAMRPQSQIR